MSIHTPLPTNVFIPGPILYPPVRLNPSLAPRLHWASCVHVSHNLLKPLTQTQCWTGIPTRGIEQLALQYLKERLDDDADSENEENRGK